MLEQISPLWDVFLQHQQQAKPLVLASLVKTQGSSYKKAGAMMLIEANKTTHGLLSGGCLEADVAEHAMSVFEDGQALRLEYDLSDDSIFGLGAGCDGSIIIVLQLLSGDYLPFSALNPQMKEAVAIDVIINHEVETGYPVGAYFIKTQESTHGEPSLARHTQDRLAFTPPPKIAICGAGTDALALNELLSFLHWHTYLIDHRPARLSTATQTARTMPVLVQHQNLPTTLDHMHFDAAIIMGHNIDRDAAFLSYFASTKTAFLGLLGPITRRDKVLKSAKLNLPLIDHRLKAPVGLDVGGRLPENIAVSVAAQLQQHFYKS